MVTANNVVEHLKDPYAAFKDASRVLKTGGIFIFCAPNLLNYGTIISRLVPDTLKDKFIYIFEGRKKEDVFKTYYKANTPGCIQKLAEAAGFKIREIKMVCNGAGFVILPPLVIIELIWIRILMLEKFKKFRHNIIAILEKEKDKYDFS